ncbi:Cell wall protein RBT1 [Candida tropicalis]
MSTTDNSQFLSTQTEHSTTILTVTSCSNDVCTETAITTGVTVVTEDETIYTTYCPLTDESTPVEESTSANTSYLLASTTDKEFIHQHDKSSLVSNGNALSTETEKLTTVITVTSCSNDACSETPITTGVRVVTSDETTYTTYCTVPTTVEFVSLIPVSSLAEPSTVVAITTFEGAANNMRLPVGAAILGLVAMMV